MNVGEKQSLTWLPDQTISFYVITEVEDTTSDSVTAKAEFAITSCVEETNYDVAISPTPFGSYEYTVGEDISGTLVPEGKNYAGSATEGVAITCSVPSIVAQYSDDYYFYGWSVNGTITKSTESYSGTVSTHTTILPVILKNGIETNDGPFSVNGQRYLFWKDAFAAAGTTYPVVVAENYTLPMTIEENGLSSADGKYFSNSGDGITYAVPTGSVLLVPFDDSGTCYTNTPEVVYESHVTPSAFRTLTIPEGVTIAVNGGLSVSSKLSAHGQNSGSWNATPTGKHGRIDMEDDSAIVLNSGGNLYAYGYVAGSGTVTAKSGSKVYECFQVRSWRGGTATSTMVLDTSKKIFPMNQYYIQNVEVPLTFESGSSEIVWTATNMNSKASASSSTFIGNGGFFVPESGSIVTKRYDGTTDRLIFDIDGNTALSAFSVTVPVPIINSLEIDTANYVMPVTNNMTVNINSGTTQIKQTVGVLPGVEVNVAKDAYVDVLSGYKVYVYDQDEWGAYAYTGGTLNCVGYSTVNGTKTMRTAADLVDAKLNINGTFEVNGEFYTTESGANIVSTSGTGKIIFTSGEGPETVTYQTTENNSAAVDISITSAQLHNGTHSTPNRYNGQDKEYTVTAGKIAAGDYYTYCMTCDMWVKGDSGLAHIIQDGDVVGHADDLTEAASDYGRPAAGKYIQMLANSNGEKVAFVDGTVLDLNGNAITGSGVSVSGTLYGMDSTSDGYGLPKGSITISGTVAPVTEFAGKNNIEGDTATLHRYLAVNDSANVDTWSFHRYNLSVGEEYYLEVLSNNTARIGVSAYFRGNSAVRSKLSEMGILIGSATTPTATAVSGVTDPYTLYYTSDAAEMKLADLTPSVKAALKFTTNSNYYYSNPWTVDFVTLLQTYYQSADANAKVILKNFADVAGIALT